ncbi:MAG TPA: hypothetical protein VFX49_14570 [Chloroflexota bacterium]|nr:hypothetical protein [Chloroflexota bacterium]
MSAWAARALRQIGLPWLRAPDSHLDHGHLPFGAWEAELTAYAQLRTGARVKVLFGHTGEVTWSDEVHLHRAPPGAAHDDALRLAELELEHQLMHFRHGWREMCLLWHCWAYPNEEIILPWPPWDQVPLPPTLVRSALERASDAFSLGELAVLARDRVRHAARWLAAAWADGVHRAIEVDERPGMADRLPLPDLPPKPRVWDSVLLCLAGACDPPRGLPAPASAAFAVLRGTGKDDARGHVTAVLELAQALARANMLPAIPDQHPAWLRPIWGRWHRERELRAQLDAIARSPATAEIASITSRGRALSARTGGVGRLGIGTGGAGKSGAGRQTHDRADQTAAQETEEALPDGWGVTPPPELPEQGQPGLSLAPGATAEGSGGGQMAGGATGAGPGTLGALHVVRPSGADRAAYWQLRGALAPHIERLIERLEAAGNLLDHAAPRRFQRNGRIDRGRLHAALAGRETVFTRHVRRPDPEHALCLLLDCSASMTTYAELLREMAILCEAAAAAVGARVTAFSFGPSWERMEPPAHGAPLVALGRELHPHGGTPFGPALQAAAAWLAQQPYVQKRLWVFSDGRWSARDRTVTGWRPEQLGNTVVWVLSGESPEPPHPAMRIEPAGTLAEFVEAAPRLFWLPPGGGGAELALSGARGGAG